MSSRSRGLFALFTLAALIGAGCTPKPLQIILTAPTHGSFSTAATVDITGSVAGVQAAAALLTVNGTPVSVVAGGAFSATVALDQNIVFNSFLLELTNTGNNQTVRERVVVIAGDSVADGAFSLDSIALRLNDTGLDSLEGVVTGLVNLDIGALLPVGTEVISNFCALDSIFGCVGSVDVSIINPPPSISSFGIDIDSLTNAAAGDVTVNDVFVKAHIDGSGLAPSCDVEFTANSLDIIGDYSLEPDAIDPTAIDVNLVTSPPGIVFTGFDSEFTSGLCDFPLIGDLIQLIIGDIQPIVVNGLRDFLDDPDGGGPLDAPVADAVEDALANISIAGPIGESLGLDLEAPLFAVDEDNAGITLGSDGRITSTPCTPPPNAPDLVASLHVPEAFPSFGATTPISGLPYGVGICLSTSAFNQLLKAEVECGLLQTTLTEIDLGAGPVPVTAGVLGLFIPELLSLPPATPLEINLLPTIAPVLTGNPGPAGELGELRLGGLGVEVVDSGSSQLLIGGQVDFRAGLDFAFDNVTSELVPTIGTVAAGDIVVDIVENPINTNAAQLSLVLTALLPQVLPTLGDSLGSFPLPQFLGLNLDGVAVEQNGEFVSLFVDLVPSP